MQAYAERLLEAQLMARAAGEVIRDAFTRSRGTIDTKSSNVDFVTETDRRCEEIIVQGIAAAYPQDGIVGEEGTLINPDAEFQWHVDPLDGTTNFVRGIPCVSVSIGIIHNGEPTVGCIYDPMHDEMYAAIVGKGATRNGLPIAVRQSNMKSLTVNINPGHRDFTNNRAINFLRAVEATEVVDRCIGSAATAMAWVADGRLDANMDEHLNSWDYTAGTVLVREAGGYVQNYDGELGPLDHGSIAAASQELAEFIQTLSLSS